MPTILILAGWRLFFYSNEGHEPMHVHAEKADMECKFWIDVDNYELTEAISYKMIPPARREIKKIIYEHFDYIVNEWNKCFTAKSLFKIHSIQIVRRSTLSGLIVIFVTFPVGYTHGYSI